MNHKSELLGEFLGTFLLVLFGCGSVAVTVLFSSHQGLMQVALAWGIGVSLAIYVTRHLSCAHLNPAVSIAMVISRRMSAVKLPVYLAGQFLGAFTGGLFVYALFYSSINDFEAAYQIIRGSADSVQTAKMFGEYYFNPVSETGISMLQAVFAEALGTFLLVLLIFSLTEGCNVGRPDHTLAPLFIGLSVTSIIGLIAPLTQAGLNPARDFGPRMIAWIFGWGEAAFPDNSFGFFWVYMLAPIAGGIVASMVFVKFIEPAMHRNSGKCCRKD
ncbi:MAG: MIP/aquaporin family protein [Bacteroidota bacterium]